MDFFSRVAGQIKDFVGGLSTSRKLGLMAIGAAIIGVTIAMFMWATHTAYQPLTYGAMNAEDTANVMRLLREKKIPFQVDTTGKQVMVPPEYLHDLRLELAMQGMPQTSGAGYELFDKQSFGTTSFLNKLNQKRALEGELMRSINSIKGVKRSRVHLAIPDKSAFVEDQKKPTASVILDLDAGVLLTERQIQGVGVLVGRAVEALDPSDVVIVDSFGKTLSKNSRNSAIEMTSDQAEYKRKLEEESQHRIEDMLSKVIGAGKVVARVTADLDFSSVTESQTILDQDGAALKSSQKIAENMDMSRTTPGGAPGAASNTPGEPAPQAGGPGTKNNTSKTNEVMNYDIPKIVRQTTKPTGQIKKLSVAVVIDSKQVKTTDKEGVTSSKAEAWSQERVKEFESIVASAVALDRTRGDTIEIKNMEFVKEDFEDAEKILDAATMRDYIKNLILYGIIALVVGLFFFFVVRPYIRWVTENTTDSVDTFLPQTLEELEKIQKSSSMTDVEAAMPDLPDRLDPEKVEGEMIREKIVTLIDGNPQKASLVLKEWLVAGKNTMAGAPAPKEGAAEESA